MSEVSHTIDLKAGKWRHAQNSKQQKSLKLETSIPRSQVARIIDGSQGSSISERGSHFWEWGKSPADLKWLTSYDLNKIKIWTKSDEIKKHSRTSPDVQFKEFWLTKQKSRPRTDYEWPGKIISKKIRSKYFKKPKNQCKNAAWAQKPLVRNGNLVQTKNKV